MNRDFRTLSTVHRTSRATRACSFIASFCFCLLLLFTLGCSSRYGSGGNGEAPKLSTLLAETPNVINLNIEKESLESAIGRTAGSRGVRIVRIFRREAVTTVPEHRIFDVEKGSPFYVLGLRSGDVLVGINDRVILETGLLVNYPKAVLLDGESSVTFRRGNELFQFKIGITEDAKLGISQGA